MPLPPAPSDQYSRILLVIAAICFIIAAVCAAHIFTGPVLAWALGGVAAYVLAWAA